MSFENIALNYNNIPDAMKHCPHWIVWKLEDKGGKKPNKTPYCVRGGKAKVNDADTWASFDEALQAQRSGAYNGIGFVFTDTPFIGVDIDGCIDKDTGEVSKEALDALETLQSYTEVSQSGGGFHIVLEGKLPPGRRRNGAFEMYGDGSPRYFAITGQLWGADREIRADQGAIDTVHRKYIATPTTGSQSGTEERGGPISDLSDQEVIELATAAQNGGKFVSLWSGDISAYGDDDSRADLALCNILAFWCQRDRARIDRLFRQSGLMRPKWDEARGRDTYGNITIEKAVAECRDVFTGSNAPRPTPEEWEAPIPFETLSTPDFPTGSLPAPVAAFVEALAESTQTPDEMAAVLSLGILATAFQSRHEVEITPDWKEPLCLYTVAIAPPGERKSAVISALSGPVYDYETTRREFEAVEIAQNQTERALLEKALQAAQMAATKAPAAGKKKGGEIAGEATINDSQECARQNALDLAGQLAAFKDKHPFRLLVDDTTPEKLMDIMDTQNGCITVASAEGGIFDALAGRYDKGANFDVYLKGHAGDTILVDRLSRKSNQIKRPRLTMLLTIQPEVLSGLMDNAAFRGRGLCGRFLYAVCKSKVGSRKSTPEPIPTQVKEDYHQFVRRILSEQDAGTIHLSSEARRIQVEYYEVVEGRLAEEWEHMRDWGGKLVGGMVRIAALVHAAEAQGNPTESPISSEVMAAAVKIAEFLGAHAMAAYQVMGADGSYEDAKYLLRRIEGTGQDEISKRDLFNICKGKFKKVDAMEPALQTLANMGYIREVDNQTGARGRPSKKIIVNPLSKNSRNSKKEC
ncbi:hypothetical protein FACS189415_1530 [Bacteroidia bacterium]|nr:hypothetical protein FACS189415_1530 [Bacteroidia bacterium]